MKSNDIKHIIHTSINSFQVSWKMTEWCNFKCPYCIAGLERQPHVPEEQCIEIAKKINILINEQLSNKKVALHLIGGEPSYYNLPHILDNIDKIDNLIVASNFSNKIDVYKELYDYCYARKIKPLLLLSYHQLQHKTFVENITELSKWCNEKDYCQPRCVLLVDENFDYSLVDTLLTNGVSMTKLTKIRELTQYTPTFSPEKEEIFKQYREKLFTKNFFTVELEDGNKQYYTYNNDLVDDIDEGGFLPQGYDCSIGKTCIRILPNGDVFRERCRVGLKHKLGNILTDEVMFTIPKDYITCDLEDGYYCECCCNANMHKRRGK